ncbi:isoleucine--tRNA ligase [Nephila pilipes]|uniref:Isoleucine--tRNA ligase n=1 Tax=Nephila pilipes TaxID=299642 RepID=A0A8X6PCJ5_NEPPI|nr:isoleucine--tRNA ligase [Nephila pilipes]
MTGSSEGSSMNGEIYIFAESYLEKFISHCEQSNIPYEDCNIKLKANDLAGLSYKPLFDYFKDTKNAFRVFVADYVTGEDGLFWNEFNLAGMQKSSKRWCADSSSNETDVA